MDFLLIMKGSRTQPLHAAPAPLPLFESVSAPEHPIVEELRRLEPETMTPLEALQKLAEWKRRGEPS